MKSLRRASRRRHPVGSHIDGVRWLFDKKGLQYIVDTFYKKAIIRRTFDDGLADSQTTLKNFVRQLKHSTLVELIPQ